MLALCAAMHSKDDEVDAAEREQRGHAAHAKLCAIVERGEALSTESEHTLICFLGWLCAAGWCLVDAWGCAAQRCTEKEQEREEMAAFNG